VLTKLFTRRTLRSGVVLLIKVTKPGMHGTAFQYTMRKGMKPLAMRLCIPVGTNKPATSCG